MKGLYVPSAEVEPHWFFRYNVLPRLYVAVAIGFLLRYYVLLLQVRDKAEFNREFPLSLETTKQLCVVIGVIGLLAMLFTRLTLLFGLIGMVIDLKLSLICVPAYFSCNFRDPVLHDLFSGIGLVSVLIYYLLIRLLLLIGKPILRWLRKGWERWGTEWTK